MSLRAKVPAEEMPPDLTSALKAAGLDAFFRDCTAAHRREYLRWIGGAKRPETRKARIEKALGMIRDKRAAEARRAAARRN